MFELFFIVVLFLGLFLALRQLVAFVAFMFQAGVGLLGAFAIFSALVWYVAQLAV